MEHADPLMGQVFTLVRRQSAVSPTADLPVSEEVVRQAEGDLGAPFPPSYRDFLRQIGARRVNGYVLFGLLGDRHWGDVVTLNRLAREDVPARFLWIAGHNHNGDDYYLDFSRRDANGECPVVVMGPEQEMTTVADDFLDFLQMICQNDGLEGFTDES